MTDDSRTRRKEELDAIRAFYGTDFLSSCSKNDDDDADAKSSNSFSSSVEQPSSSDENDNDNAILNGPWKIRIQPHVILEIHDIPEDYPSSSGADATSSSNSKSNSDCAHGCCCPRPILRAPVWILDEQRRKELEGALLEDLYIPDTELVILWVEHCRLALEQYEVDKNHKNHHHKADEPQKDEEHDEEAAAANGTSTETNYKQPRRTFAASMVDDDTNKREIICGATFHPPKSGSSELMVGHVASVTCLEHVQWVLAELLVNKNRSNTTTTTNTTMYKKIRKASHNMYAYQFYDTEKACYVADNEDDGERGAGTKLASLLDLSQATNCIVIVSRWYGGIHLGPARFKYIAMAGRDALLKGKFI